MTGGGLPAPWRGGWRVALRLARRDIRAHKGRSAIVVAMILLPVAIMVGGLGLVETARVDATERPEAMLGSASAVLAYSGPVAMQQSPDATAKSFCDGGSGETGGRITPRLWEGESADSEKQAEAESESHCRRSLPVPGIDPAVGAPSPQTAVEPLSRLVGAPVVPYVREPTPLGIDFGYEYAEMLRADASREVFRGMVDLTSGRWPSAPGEVVLTRVGESIGLPAQGTIDSEPLRAALGVPSVTVVGTATAPLGPLGHVHLITTLPAPAVPAAAYYLVDSARPVPWSQVEYLNTYGLVVFSRAVLDDPPYTPADSIDGWVHGYDESQAMATVTWALMFTLLLAASCLIAGPAFSVMASRQRRMLALVAANGGSAAQLRRTVLAQAVVLGLSAVLLGVAAGVAGVVAAKAVWEQLAGGSYGPLDIPLGPTLAIAAAGFGAAVVTALIPARGLGRLEVTRALAGEAVPRRAPLGHPVLGVALLLLGTVGCAGAIVSPYVLGVPGSPDALLGLAFGVTAVIVGTLLLVPSVLLILGKLARRLPLPARLAARDATRQLGRSTSTVAAVMAGAITLSGFGIGLAATDDLARRTYVPGAPAGHMTLRPPEVGSPTDLRRTVEAAVAGVRVREVSALTVPEGHVTEAAGEAAAQEQRTPYVGLLQPGCDLDAPPRLGYTAPCLVTMPGGSIVGVLVAGPESARALFGLSSTEETALRAGGALVFDAGDAVSVIDGSGSVTIAAGRVREQATPDPFQQWESPPAQHRLPAHRIAFPAMQLDGHRALAVIASDTAARLGVEPTASSYIAGPADPASGGLTDEQAARINRALGTVYDARVERGYDDSGSRVVWAALLGLVALLTLAATLTATALSMGEMRRDLATVGAVGGSPGTRRRVSAWHAGGLAFVGTALGIAAGAIPAVFFSLTVNAAVPDTGQIGLDGTGGFAATAERLRLLSTGFVEVPWAPLLVALVAVPLVAALFGALFAGGRVDLTRRMD